MTTVLIASFAAVCAAGIVAAAVLPDRRSPQVVAWAGSAAALLMLASGFHVLTTGRAFHGSLWSIPGLGLLTLAADRLSGLFLCVAALVFLPVSVFSAAYLRRYLGHYSLRMFCVWFLLLFVTIGLILIAGDVLTFFMAWEMMSVLCYILVGFEHEREANTHAGYVMLAMGEAGALAALASFLLIGQHAGTLEFSGLRLAAASLHSGARWAVFLLSFFGFGVKAGLVPVNSWLPRAHPVAPANVSAVLSAVILNLGLYGIVRVNLDIVPPALIGTGLVALITGTISAFVGILYATTERDLKVMLAHSSIENIGIVTAALGAGFVFLATGHPVIASIALTAGLYHMTNHSIYKALLFLGAGTVDASAGTRDLDLLGGLIRKMPWTAFLFLVGALSISAMPPFSGFASEWLTLQSMLRCSELPFVGIKLVFALCGATLALTAALAVTCFVKAFAMGFLGQSRSNQAERAMEPPRTTIGAMAFLAALCLMLGVLPTYVVSTIDPMLAPMAGSSSARALVPPFLEAHPSAADLPPAFAADFRNIGAGIGRGVVPGRGLVVLHRGGKENPVVFAMSTSYMFLVLASLFVIVYAVVRYGLSRERQLKRQARWDGGASRLLPEMSYTATGFSNPVRVIFDAIFRPTVEQDTREIVVQHFRSAILRQRQEVHIVDRLVLRPLVRVATAIADGLAALHHGRINAYAAYALAALLVVLCVVIFVGK